jgi:predicted lipoprotein with Yx(FWY)xxD motif
MNKQKGRRDAMKKYSLLFGVAVLMLFALKTAFATDPDVTVMQKEGIGKYLADSKGRTLYWFKNDSPKKSTCTGKCLELWIPFYNGAILSASPEMNLKDFGTIVRQDGKKQNTFRSYPLYYYYMDEQPGDTKGQNFNNLWHVVDPVKFRLTEKEYFGYSETKGTTK